jgi:hypothetical protein
MNAPLPPAYYLRDFEAVLQDVRARYGDLLHGEEHAQVQAFLALPEMARRLYVRLLTRKGPWFREDGLDYAEIGPPQEPLRILCERGFCVDRGDTEELLPLLVRSELADGLKELGIPCAKAGRREALTQTLLEGADPEVLREWLHTRLRPVRPLHGELWSLLFFLFFGNGEQDLSSFVLADTGRIVHEAYVVDREHRLFQSRADVDFLLSAASLREDFEGASAAGDHAAMALLTERVLAMDPHPGVRQQRRYHRLLNVMGQAWERLGEGGRALACFGRSGLPPARERMARITAKAGDGEEACRLAERIAGAPLDPGEERFARVFLQRHARKVPAAARWLERHPHPEPVPERHLELDFQGSVELAVLEAARGEGWEGFFAENVLWNALFGLVFWDVLFAPVPGAFQHRFQAAPLDVGQPGFYARREGLFETRLAEIVEGRTFAERVLETAKVKWGVANAFLAWRHLSLERLQAAATRIPPRVAAEVLRTLARNPRAFGSGFPDLFLFRPEGPEWALWEVKGPGDHLRPEQERWLRCFRQLGGEAWVVWVKRSPS